MSRTYKRVKSAPARDFVGTWDEWQRSPGWRSHEWGLSPEKAYKKACARHHACNHSGRWNAPKDFRRSYGIKLVRLREDRALVRHLQRDDWDNHTATNRFMSANRYYF